MEGTPIDRMRIVQEEHVIMSLIHTHDGHKYRRTYFSDSGTIVWLLDEGAQPRPIDPSSRWFKSLEADYQSIRLIKEDQV